MILKITTLRKKTSIRSERKMWIQKEKKNYNFKNEDKKGKDQREVLAATKCFGFLRILQLGVRDPGIHV